jgi:hypothetical protein
VRRVGKACPDVGADLGDDRCGRQQPWARDRHGEVPGGAQGLHHPLHPGIERRDHAGEVIEVVQVRAAQHRVMVPEAALQRHRHVGDLAPHLPLGQIRQHLAAPHPVDQRLDHRPPRLRPDFVAMDEATEAMQAGGQGAHLLDITGLGPAVRAGPGACCPGGG